MGLCCGYDLVTDFALGILAGVGEVVRDRSNGGTAEITGSDLECRAVGSMICKVTGLPTVLTIGNNTEGLGGVILAGHGGSRDATMDTCVYLAQYRCIHLILMILLGYGL